MIASKSDFVAYLEADRRALGVTRKRPRLFTDDVWRYQVLLRRCEYLHNVACRLRLARYLFVRLRLHRAAVRLGFSVPLNAFGPGLSIAHYGQLTVHRNARVGSYCRIHEGVTIGANKGSDEAPEIGDYVFIGSGAKIIGPIKIADRVAIGANAVVTRDVLEPGVTVAGVPARKISSEGSAAYLQFQ